MSDKKIVDTFNKIPDKRGDGILRREVWVDMFGTVTRYNLAYINHDLYQQDHGRVVGYDNAHGVHHRHYMGVVKPVNYISFDDIEEQFARDWTSLRRQP